MLGEHGASQFAAMSCVSFGCKTLADLAAEQPERFGFDQLECEEEARHGGYVTYAGKGCTEYARCPRRPFASSRRFSATSTM